MTESTQIPNLAILVYDDLIERLAQECPHKHGFDLYYSVTGRLVLGLPMAQQTQFAMYTGNGLVLRFSRRLKIEGM